VTSTIAAILDAMVAATVLVGLCTLLLHWYLSSLPAAASIAETVSQLRSSVEQVVDLVADGSATVWIACLALLALLCLLVSRSSSRRRWNEALTARRSALVAALASVSDDELGDRATKADPAGVQALDSRMEALKKVNMARIEELMSKPALQIGNDP